MPKADLTDSILAITFCVATALSIHIIPTHYAWEQTFSIEGILRESKSLETVILKLASPEPKQTSKISAIDFSCTLSSVEKAVCKGRSKNKKEAKAVEDFFKIDLTRTVGKVSRDEVVSLVEEKKQRIHEIEQDLTLLSDSINAAKKRLQPQSNTHFDKASQLQAELIKNIADKKQQLALIEGAIPSEKDPSVLERFQQKKEQLKRSLDELNKDLTENSSQTEMTLSSDPEARELLLSKAKLLQESQVLQRNISDLEYALEADPDRTLFNDPDAYRVSVPKPLALHAQRDFKHLPWSLALGLIPFGLLRKFRSRAMHASDKTEGITQSDDFFNSPEEIESATGLKHLGTLN